MRPTSLHHSFACVIAVCAALAAPPWPQLRAAAPGAQREAVEIEVRRLPDESLWQVAYTLAEPAGRLVFAHNANLFRVGSWQLVTPGLELAVEREHEVIRSASDERFTHVVLQFESDNTVLPKDYELNLRFSDGGELIYTGHLEVRPEPTASTAVTPRTRLTFHGGGPDRVLYAGRTQAVCVVTEPEGGFGNYVYFGSAAPVETESLLAILDPGLPGWVRVEAERLLPQLFALYTERLGLELETRPLVFFSYDEGEAGRYGYSGGTLPGIVQLSVRGQGWKVPDADPDGPFRALMKFLAHESAHLWNSQIVANDDAPGAAWLHEGSADALAFRALFELGVIDEDELYRLYSGAMNECLASLAGGALRTAADRRDFGAFYCGGSTVALATEVALRAKQPDADLFEFWRSLLQEARARGTPYTEASYYALVDRLAPGSELGRTLREFVETHHADPMAAVEALFAGSSTIAVRRDPRTGTVRVAPR